MKLVILASGSSGNSALVINGDHKLILDCGVGMKQFRNLLTKAGEQETGFDGILLTHKHGDHAGHVQAAANRYHCPIYASEETCEDKKFTGVIHRLRDQRQVSDFWVEPIKVPHCQGALGFAVVADGRRLLFLHDLGCITQDIMDAAVGCHVLAIESNYDSSMLNESTYGPALKKRLESTEGHLSNELASRFIYHACSVAPELHAVVLLHLSRNTNTRELAETAALKALKAGKSKAKLFIAQDDPLPAIEV